MKKILCLTLMIVLAALTAGCGSNSGQGTAPGVYAGQRTLLAAQLPIITGFAPSWQAAGSAITLYGANFDPVSANNAVSFNGVPAVVASASATALVVIVPSGATMGPISVTTDGGLATSATNFVVIGGSTPPTISGFSPAGGATGTTVTISGTNFSSTAEYNLVTFNGTKATVTAATDSTLTVSVPDAISGNITVTTPGGAAVSASTFNIVLPEGTAPAIRSFSPLRAPEGTSVLISGRNFDPTPENNVVRFNGIQATIASGSATSLAVTVPAGAASGPITVSNPAGLAKSAAAFTVSGSGGTIAGLMGGAIQGNSIAGTLAGTALTFAGGGVVNSAANGTGTDARFNNPNGITSDGTNLYIADAGNRVIRKMVLAGADAGKVTTLAGSGVAGSADGPGLAASFSTPNGITTDGVNLYLADSGNNRIRMISPRTGTLADMTSDEAVVTTIAGSGSIGFNDAVGTAATFKGPYGITTDGTSLFVADGSNRIRRIHIASAAVTTLAGSGAYSSTDGTGTAASFYRPHGITISPDLASLFVTDSGTNVIRKVVIATAEVSTVAGSGLAGAADGTGAAASFQNPNGLATDGSNLYVADMGNNRIRQIELATMKVTTIAGTGNVGSADNAVSLLATFRLPGGVTVAGTDVYVADSGNNLIRKISGQGVVTVAGSTAPPSPNTNAIGTAATFNFPYGITTDGTNLYVTDSGMRTIRKIVIATGMVSNLAGSGYFGSVDAKGTAASFNYPMGITTDGTYLYVADAGSQKIRQVVISTGEVSTVAGSGVFGSTDGIGALATFSQPYGITTDGSSLYVADSGSNKIRRIVIATGEVSTLAGSGAAGATDSVGTAASFQNPTGITTDGVNLYVGDTGNNKIRKIVIATGEVSTLAGSGLYWNNDIFDTLVSSWTGAAANFRSPAGLTCDGTYLYVADANNNQIRKIQIATGTVTAVAGEGVFGASDGTGTEASFSQPVGITTDGTYLYTTEYLDNLIRKIQ